MVWAKSTLSHGQILKVMSDAHLVYLPVGCKHNDKHGKPS